MKKNISFIYFFNMDISFNMAITLIKMYLLIIDIIMEGRVSEIFYLGPILYFIQATLSPGLREKD